MTRRLDSPLPLIIGFALATAAHLAAASPIASWLSTAKQHAGPPDLRVVAITTPDNTIILNQSNTAQYEIVNRGQTATGPSAWTDCLYVSADDRLDNSDTLLLTTTRPHALEAGERYQSDVLTFDLPKDITLPFYLIVQTDAEDVIDERWLEQNNTLAHRFDPAQEDEPKIAVGKIDAPKRQTVAWISHEDFQSLLAPKSVTDQPALQNKVEPIEGASIELDPTPPAANAQPQPNPQAPSQAGGSLTQRPTAEVASAPPLPEHAEPAVVPASIDSQHAPAQPNTHTQPGEGDSTADASASTDHSHANPTAVPRDEGESPPVIRSESVTLRPGSVMTGPGIEVKTHRPYFGGVARASAVATNPRAEVTFDATGTVVFAEITKSSGQDNVDAPILASLYKWKAKGEKIDNLGETKLVMPVHLILN